MLKRLVEDLDSPSSEFESNNKKKKIEHKQQYLIFNSDKILDNILSFVNCPSTQLNLFSSCKQVYNLRKSLPNKYLCDIHHSYSQISDKKQKEMLYRLNGFLRNLYIKQGVEFKHALMVHDIDETVAKINCHVLNAHNFYFKNGLIEVLGFYCEDADGELYSSCTVKFSTHDDQSVVLHQNLKVSNLKVKGHYCLAIEKENSEFTELVSISKKPTFDITAFDNLLFKIKGNFQTEVFFRVMLGIAGLIDEDKYLNVILSSYENIKNPPPPPSIPLTSKQRKKQKGCLGSKDVYYLRYYWCSITSQLDSLIELLKYGDDSNHTETMTKHLMELIYKSMASFSEDSEELTKLIIPEISNQFISGKCFLKNGVYTFIAKFKKTNGGKFKILLYKPEDHEEDSDPYSSYRLIFLDPKDSIYEEETLKLHEKSKVKRIMKKLIPGIRHTFCSLSNCIIGLVFTRGYLINYDSNGDFTKSVWEEIDIPPKIRKDLSASIEAGQIGAVEDLEPLTLFWVEDNLTTCHGYDEAPTSRNPKIKEEVFEFVTNLIEEYRLLERDSIIYQKYGVFGDGMRTYGEPIGKVYDFEYQEKNLYYVQGDTFHYCAIVCGYEDIVICGEAAEPKEIFYWTPQCYFRTGEGADDDGGDAETYDISHIKPLKKLKKGSITFDRVLDNIEEFFNQFL